MSRGAGILGSRVVEGGEWSSFGSCPSLLALGKMGKEDLIWVRAWPVAGPTGVLIMWCVTVSAEVTGKRSLCGGHAGKLCCWGGAAWGKGLCRGRGQVKVALLWGVGMCQRLDSAPMWLYKPGAGVVVSLCVLVGVEQLANQKAKKKSKVVSQD